MTKIYDRVALIGLGLIAGSMSHAIKRGGLANEVVGYARSSESRDIAREIGLCDRICDTAQDAVKDADLVVLCVPVGAMAAVAAEIGPSLKPGCTVSDVSGPRSGFAELFDNRWCIVVPAADTDKAALEQLRALWIAMGSNVEEMDAEHHDRVLAVTSHIPHLIAYTMVGVADDLGRVTDSEVIQYSAAGFRDFTRIASSDPTMWRDVFLANKDATLEILGRFTEELFALQRAIRQGDGDHLHEYFTHTREIRRGIIEAGQDTDAPDFGRGGARN